MQNALAAPVGSGGDVREVMLRDVVDELGKDVSQAFEFITAEFEGYRAKAQRYYNGESDLAVDANRSRYVDTKVRDVVRNIRPSLMRTMLACQYPVEFVPMTAAQGGVSEMQTKYISQLFYDLGGYKTIYAAFHSAMLFKLGVVKYYYERSDEQIFRSYTGLNQMQVEMLTSHPLVSVVAAEERQMVGPQGMATIYDLEVVGTKPRGDIKMSWVPLSEFVVNRSATGRDDFKVMAHRRDVTKGEAVAMGFTMDQLESLNSDNADANRFTNESSARRGYSLLPQDVNNADDTQNEVLLTEAYYRADLDGTGIGQLYRFWLGGTSYELLDYERVDHVPFALFSIDPEPGALFGKSVFDLVEKDQDASTSLTRATIDNFHMTNNPRLAVHENMVNMTDVLNNEMGSPIRVRAAGQIQVIQTPFTGGQALPLLQKLDRGVEQKTGVTAAASGLDPDAMQSTDKDAVRNTIQLAQGQVELMARNLGETGMVDLFKGLLHLAMTHLDTNQILRTPDGMQPVPLNMFDPTMATQVRVGTGTGNFEEQMGMLSEIQAEQKQLMGQLGPGNPVVTMQHMQNVIDDKMRLLGMHNPRRYFAQVTPEMEQQMAQSFQQDKQRKEQAQQQIAAQQANALQEAERIKAEAKLMVAQGEGQIDMAQLKEKHDAAFRSDVMADDLARDKMLQDLFIAVAQLQKDLASMGAVESIQAQQRVN